ncbi:hypothetical protein B0H67DRAFT_640309 [Lasiosphaeris hirsuta]|uniref:Fork-head domain-containing protein n=1 Tax=Lasiosphaeris hirsuta TaxID=260670 RepID=A0AA40BD56_9PEZI|nr:hypothetical protein B0H67DRAFT_640309 [Lasiosphaeris hirsuta]
MDPALPQRSEPSPSIASAEQTSQPFPPPSSSEMADFLKLEPGFSVAPQQRAHTSALSTNTSYSSGYANGDAQFDASISGLPTHDDNGQAAPYMSPKSQGGSLWSASVRSQTGGDDFEHYALHSSPTAAGFPSQVCSNQSSPRSWGSPDQFPAAFEPAPEPLQNQFPRHQQYGGFPLRESINYMQNSPGMLPATSFPAAGTYMPEGFHHTHQPGQYHYAVAQDGLPAMLDHAYPLSPCNSNMGFRGDDDLPSTAPASETGDEFASSQYPSEVGPRSHSRQSSAVPSPASCGVAGGVGGTPGHVVASSKHEEPYAQLIYKAFMSVPRHAMTLQDMYQWFRDNTDKGKSETKGWQNSIRHNLSMNRRERTSADTPGAEEAEGGAANPASAETLSLSPSGASVSGDNKKSTEWFLEPWAIKEGVQSTTRYRKGNSSRRSHHPSPRRDSAYGHGHGNKGGHGHGRKTDGIPLGKARSRHHVASGPLRSNGAMHLPATTHYPHHHNTMTPSHHPQQLFSPMPMVGVSTAHHYGGGAHFLPPGIVDCHGDYTTDPQLYPPPHHPHAQHGLGRAPSESGIDEPVTPEPAYADQHQPGLLLPGSLTGGDGGSSAPFYGGTDGGVMDLAAAVAGYPFPSAAAAAGVVDVYGEKDLESYHLGWGGAEGAAAAAAYHQQQHPHPHPQQQPY